MSLEAKIEALTAALIANTAALSQNQTSVPVQQAAPAPMPVQAPAPAAPVAEVPAFAAPVAMPPGPSFAPPPAQAAPGAPFTDTAGLVKYAMDAYSVLGQEKGAQIQAIITHLGKVNINDITPDQYPQFFAAVEALKAQ